MKLLRKLFAAKKRNQKEVKSLVGLHSSAMRSEKCEARSRTLVGVVSGTFLERQASTSYTVISLVSFNVQAKNNGLKKQSTRRLFSMSSYVLAMASSCYGSVNSKQAHPLRAFVGFLSFLFGRPANAPQWGQAVH